MNYLMIGIVVLSIIVLVLGFLLLYYQVLVVNSMKKDFKRMYNELGRELGFDTFDWSNNFSDMRRTVNKNKKQLDEINSLPVIIKAKEVKHLEELQRTKSIAEKEIEKLTKNVE
ncbi:TPA: hypothetical protein ACG6RF_002082 [Streptococcus agalactiae]|nr:hypothetical protein [Streptococcus agalactiae]HEO2267341.1 hypothetical protein [Streptococcus agalactiae]